MWRAFFLAMGFYVMILGAECLGIETVNFNLKGEPPKSTGLFGATGQVGSNIQYSPPPWLPWSLMSIGAVTCLYSFTIPRRVSGN